MVHADHHNFSQSTDIAMQDIIRLLYNKEFMQKHLLCEKVEPSKVESCRHGSECMNRFATPRSDIRIRPGLSLLNT